MYKRNGTDTLIGFIPGADIGEGAGSSKGGLAKAPPALAKMYGWKGVPALGSYTYPAGGASELWDFQRAQGFAGVVSYRAFAIPNGYTIADVRSGKCDAIWVQRAHNMVDTGQGDNCIYEPGYEGADKNFNGSAGQVVPKDTVGSHAAYSGNVLGAENWAYAVNRQVHVMRTVAGWNPWFGINYDCLMAGKMGLDPDPFHYYTESFQSIDTELYPMDDYSGSWSAANDPVKLRAYMQLRLDTQQKACKKYNVPLGIGETAPMIKDSHASGDDAAFVQFLHDYAMDTKNNVAHLWLYNGTTSGDTSRFALYDKANNLYTLDKVKFPKSGVAIGALMDPSKFIDRTATTPPVEPPVKPPTTGDKIYSQAEMDAAVKAATEPLNAIIVEQSAQIATLQDSVASLTAYSDEIEEEITTIKSDWAKHVANMQETSG